MRHRSGTPGGRGFLYIRVSGAEQERDGWSLDGQRARGLAWFAAQKLPPPEVRVEVESAGEEKIERRVELARLIRDAKPGDIVAVAVLDRWSRDIVFGVQSVRQLVRAGVRWYAIHEQIDATTPEGDSNLGLRMWLAEEERKRIRARTLGRAEELLVAGLWAYGAVPYGYRRGDRKARRHLHLEPHPDRAPVVVAWHERLAGGDSLRTVAEWLAVEHPDAPHCVQALRDSARRRIYLGELWCRGEWVRGQHPPLVSLDLWERAQRALDGRRNGGRRPGHGGATAECLLRGLVSCALCGAKVSAVVTRETRPDRETGEWLYYVCAARKQPGRRARCAGPWVPADALDAAAEEAILARLEELRGALLAEPEPHDGGAARPHDDPAAARARVEAKLARAVSLAVAGDITSAELAEQRRRLGEELDAIRRREEAGERAERGADPARRGDRARALGQLRRAWGGLNVARRREAASLLAERVELDGDGALRWTWRSAEDLAAG